MCVGIGVWTGIVCVCVAQFYCRGPVCVCVCICLSQRRSIPPQMNRPVGPHWDEEEQSYSRPQAQLVAFNSVARKPEV